MAPELHPRDQLRRILVATDFPAGAADGLARALTPPVAPGAEVTLLHVEPSNWSSS